MQTISLQFRIQITNENDNFNNSKFYVRFGSPRRRRGHNSRVEATLPKGSISEATVFLCYKIQDEYLQNVYSLEKINKELSRSKSA